MTDHTDRLQAMFDVLNAEHFDRNLPDTWISIGIPDGFEGLNGLTQSNCVMRRGFCDETTIYRYPDGLDGPKVGEPIPEETQRRMFGGPSRYRASSNIYLSDWLLDTPCVSEDVRWRMISDVLLHEMVHVHVVRKWGRRGGHHGARFTAECNAIGRRLGWEDAAVPGSWDDEEWNTSVEWPIRSDDSTDALSAAAITGMLVAQYGWSVEEAYASVTS